MLRALSPHGTQLARLPGACQSLGKVRRFASLHETFSYHTRDALQTPCYLRGWGWGRGATITWCWFSGSTCKFIQFLPCCKWQHWGCQNLTSLSWGSVPCLFPPQSLAGQPLKSGGLLGFPVYMIVEGAP